MPNISMQWTNMIMTAWTTQHPSRQQATIRNFCCVLNRVIHAEYVIVCALAEDGIDPEEWKQYFKGGGRCKFQINLGLA